MNQRGNPVIHQESDGKYGMVSRAGNVSPEGTGNRADFV